MLTVKVHIKICEKWEYACVTVEAKMMGQVANYCKVSLTDLRCHDPQRLQRDLLAWVHTLFSSLTLQMNIHLPQLGFQSTEEFAMVASGVQENHPPNKQHPLLPCS